MKKTILAASIGLVFIGLSIAIYPGVDNLSHATAQAQLKKGVSLTRTDQRNETIPLPEGTICVLTIPKIGLNLGVYEGTTDDVLEKGPGHFEETVLPGEKGNCCIAGHRNISGSPFADLDKLEASDELIVYTQNGKFVYRVIEKKIVVPTDLSVIQPTAESRLTLTTCQRQGADLNRLIIVGRGV